MQGVQIASLLQLHLCVRNTQGAVLGIQREVIFVGTGAAVQMAVHLVNAVTKIGCCSVDGILVPQLAQQTKQPANGATQQLALQRGQHTALQDVARLCRIQHFLSCEHTSLTGQSPAQHEVGGYIIIIAGFYHERQARLTDTVLIVAQQRLRNTQITGSRTLGNASFPAQQR